MEEKPFYMNGLHFSCKRCSFCCGHSPGFVYLSERDLRALCRYFSLSMQQCAERYCRWAQYYGGTVVLALREQKNYDCILWAGGCTAYSARPVQCETYPFWPWMVQDAGTWNECAENCPGMNSGQIWTRAQIDAACTRHAQNEPIQREVLEMLLGTRLSLPS
ncbi:MAG: YkgJ family cysteine cluster protein [Treponema sp.]|nr:YkgJ family cysteine cluster protein [Treponema sp.]